MSKYDFRTAKEAARDAVTELNGEDADWKWGVNIRKDEVRIYWGYLDYMDEGKYFSVCNGDHDDFIVAKNEHGDVLTGAIIGNEFWCDGNLNRCVYKLIKAIGYVAHTQY